MICWTLGITEHHNAVDNVLALINLALLTGHVGRWGSGINPLRGQNNVQGGGDMGALPDRFPGFQHVENDEVRARFDRAWGVATPPTRGWHLTGMFEAMERGDLQGALRHRREPGAVGSRSASHRAPAGRPRGAGGAGRDVHRHGGDRRRGAAGRGRRVRVRGHGHVQRAARAAGAARQDARRREPRRPRHHLRAWRGRWAPTGARPMPSASGTSCARCRRCTPA